MDSSALNLPNEYREKLAHIRTLTQQDDQTALLAAIDLYYAQLTQTTDPLTHSDNEDNATLPALRFTRIAQAKGILKSKKNDLINHLNHIRQDWESS